MPDANIHRLSVGAKHISFREAPLTLTMLAALAPPELSAEFTLVDESVTELPANDHWDLVGISILTGTSTRGYLLADRFRTAGCTVVLGGVHVSLCPEEAAGHADIVVTGFAEHTWPRLLRDFAGGKVQARYDDRQGCIQKLPTPRRDLQTRCAYAMPQTVFATRGCRGGCSFCSVNAAKFGWSVRPVAEVIDEVRQLPGRRFAFNDVSLLEDRDYALELFTALKSCNKEWGGLCTSKIGADEEMLQLMGRAGCRYLLIGFESVSDETLYDIRKRYNNRENYVILCDRLHRARIAVQGCFIFGFDHDDYTVFDKTVEAVEQLKIDIPRYALYTPYPRTPGFKKLRAQGRLLHTQWEHYDTQHVVIQPAKMTPSDLDSGFIRAYKQTFGLKAIARRTLRFSKNAPVVFVGNLAYRMYISRLENEENRILPSTSIPYALSA